MTDRPEGRTALVTASGNGIGEEVAPALAARGATDAAAGVSGQVFDVKGSEVMRWTDVADGPSVVEDGDPRGLQTLDEQDVQVPEHLMDHPS